MYLFVQKQMLGWNHPHHEQSALLLAHNSLHCLCLLITQVQPVVKQISQPNKKAWKNPISIRVKKWTYQAVQHWLPNHMKLTATVFVHFNDHIMCSLITYKTEAVTEQQNKYTCTCNYGTVNKEEKPETCVCWRGILSKVF